MYVMENKTLNLLFEQTLQFVLRYEYVALRFHAKCIRTSPHLFGLTGI
jgi:hypothetical protein